MNKKNETKEVLFLFYMDMYVIIGYASKHTYVMPVGMQENQFFSFFFLFFLFASRR